MRHAWREFSCCLGIAAGKQRNLMAFSDKLLGEPGDDTLSSAVKSWANSFCQRRNLGIAYSWLRRRLVSLTRCPFRRAFLSSRGEQASKRLPVVSLALRLFQVRGRLSDPAAFLNNEQLGPSFPLRVGCRDLLRDHVVACCLSKQVLGLARGPCFAPLPAESSKTLTLSQRMSVRWWQGRNFRVGDRPASRERSASMAVPSRRR